MKKKLSKKQLEEELIKKKGEKTLKNKRQLQSLIQQMNKKVNEAINNVKGENTDDK